MEPLKLSIFKDIYHSVRTNIPWLDHLLIGLLKGLEGWYINQKVHSSVDDAIAVYEASESVSESLPIYSETEDGEMRLTAPWYSPLGKITKISEEPYRGAKGAVPPMPVSDSGPECAC